MRCELVLKGIVGEMFTHVCVNCGKECRTNTRDSSQVRQMCGTKAASPPPRITAERFPCLHRGEQIDTRECQTCGSRGVIEPVYACGLHGKCMMRPWRVQGEEGVQICLRCEDRPEPTAPADAAAIA